MHLLLGLSSFFLTQRSHGKPFCYLRILLYFQTRKTQGLVLWGFSVLFFFFPEMPTPLAHNSEYLKIRLQKVVTILFVHFSLFSA